MSLNTTLNPINGYQSMLNRSQLSGDILNVNNLTVNNSFRNQGSTSLVGSLDVSGISTFENNVIIKANVSIHENIDVSGISTFNNNVIIQSLDVSGISTFNNDVNINADMTVDNLDVSGTLTVNNITLANDLDVSGKLTVEGTATFMDQLNILNIDPSLVIQSTGNAGIIINSNSDGVGVSDYNYIAFRSNNIDKVIIGYDDAIGNGEINKNSSSIPLDIYSQTNFKNIVNVSGHPSYQALSTDVSNNLLYIENLKYDLSNNINVNNINIFGDTRTYSNVGINKAPSTSFALDVSGKTILRDNLVMDDATTIIAQNIISETDCSFNRVNITSTFTVDGYGTFQTLRTDASNNMFNIQTLTSDISGYNISQLRTDVSNNLLFIQDLQNDLSNNISLNNVIANDISANSGYYQLLRSEHYGTNIDISGRLTIKDGSGLNPTICKIRMITNAGNSNIYGQNDLFNFGYNIGFSDRLFIAKYDTSAVYTDILTLDASSHVGIRNNNPTEALDILGGNLYLHEGSFFHINNNDVFQRIWYKKSSGSTQYGGIVFSQDASGTEVGALVCWSDQNNGTMSINRFNGQRAYYSNNTMCHIKGEYQHSSGFWQNLAYDRFTNNASNVLQNSIQRGFYIWDVGNTDTTIFIYTGSIPKYYNVSCSCFIDNTAYQYDYELRYTTSAGVERTISFTTQAVNQKGVSLNGIAYLDANGCEIRLYIKTTYITVVPGILYCSMTATEVF